METWTLQFLLAIYWQLQSRGNSSYSRWTTSTSGLCPSKTGLDKSVAHSLKRNFTNLPGMASPAAVDVAVTEPFVHKQTDPDLVEKLSGLATNAIPDAFILPEGHRPAVALNKSGDEIPVVDMAGLTDERRPHTLALIHKACVDWGFFQVINHGVDLGVMKTMRQRVKEFLALPVNERAPGGVKKGFGSQGYGSGYVSPDTGVCTWRDYFVLRTYPETMRDYSAWPSNEAFRHVIEQYTMELKGLAERVLECLSINLGLHPNYLKDALGQLHQALVINHYPSCPRPDLAVGANRHTDLGAVTCLWQPEDVLGLQVLHNGEWVPVTPIREAYIINVADMVEVASNGIYKSGVHRAVVNSSRDRVSIVAFYDVHPEAIVEPAPELVTAELPALYQPVRFCDHARKYAIEVDKI